MTKCIVAALQMQSQDNLEDNLRQAAQLMEQAQQAGVQLVVLPENFAMFAAGKQLETAQNLAKIQQWLSQQAQQQQMWIVAGSIPCATRPDSTPVADNKVRASCLIYSPQGQLFGRYDKIHLFDANVADQQASYQESATFEAGSEVVIVETPFAKIGISICYDLRFPLLYQALRDNGAEIIVVPAAFTALTGEAHWQVLLRARAIETQSFVIGAGQSGWHSATRQTWGHSQVIDPWGKVLAEQQQTGSGLIVAVCDLSELHLIRQQMPILRHRRLF